MEVTRRHIALIKICAVKFNRENIKQSIIAYQEYGITWRNNFIS